MRWAPLASVRCLARIPLASVRCLAPSWAPLASVRCLAGSWAWAWARITLVLTITLAAGHAVGHIAPSVDDNNRYVKLTPAADRIRLAYTVFFGEVPGAQARHTIDGNRDGQISDAEARAFADSIASEVAPDLDLTIDGARHAVTWTTIAAGMGTPQTAAGAFSIDLVAWICLPSQRVPGHHKVLLHDRFRIPRPGETEVKVEDSPGITIDHARIGPATDPSHDFRFVGPGGPMTDDGLELSFTVSETAPRTADATCSDRKPAAKPSPPITMIVGLAAGCAFVLALIAALVIRAGKKRRA